jgi:MerR family transcriptional regulator, copper efflux regulator
VRTLRISELAERSGLSTSTLRYYERIGLLQRPARAENGYRVYGEEALEQLRLIGRAKRLGMTLDDITELVALWDARQCGPIQARLREQLTASLADARRQIEELRVFERDVEAVLGRILAMKDPPQECEPDCGCLDDVHNITRVSVRSADGRPGLQLEAGGAG